MTLSALVEKVTSGVLSRVDKSSLVANGGGDQRSGKSHGSNSEGGETHREVLCGWS